MKRPKDVLKWVAAGFALVATASAEYELARAIGMHPVIAAAVPGALDAYAVRALRAHREVFTAVLAMVGVNAASHLVTAGVLHVGWPLITAVSAIAPLVLWRVHALSTRGEVQLDLIHDVPVPAGEPEPLADVHPVPVEPEERSEDTGPVAKVLTLPTGPVRGERPARTHLNSEAVQERFWDQVTTPDPENGCMHWAGHRSSNGYGRFSIGNTSHGAHRVAYEIAEGPVPEGLVVDHLCRNSSCVNPTHLEPVTISENKRRGDRDRKNGAPVQTAAPFPSGNIAPDVLQEARHTFPAGVPTVREVKRRMNVGSVKAQAIIAALKNGETRA